MSGGVSCVPVHFGCYYQEFESHQQIAEQRWSGCSSNQGYRNTTINGMDVN